MILQGLKMPIEQEQNELIRQLTMSDSEILKEEFFKYSTEHKRTILTSILRNQPCEVTFRKVDGSIRKMPCTLQPNVLPPIPVHESNTDNSIDFPKVKKQNPDNLSVWCLDKKEWRSFKIDNIISVKVLQTLVE